MVDMRGVICTPGLVLAGAVLGIGSAALSARAARAGSDDEEDDDTALVRGCIWVVVEEDDEEAADGGSGLAGVHECSKVGAGPDKVWPRDDCAGASAS